MKKLVLTLASLFLLAEGFSPVEAQSTNEAISKFERTLDEKESQWQCQKGRDPGEPGENSPRGTRYSFTCRREQQTILGSILFGDSKGEAVKMLEFSQQMLAINASKPVAGIGEQAYEYAGRGSAWITFRDGKIFGQVNVSIVDARKVLDHSPEMHPFTKEALEIAKRFVQHIVAATP